MKNRKDTAASTPEMVTISRAEYERLKGLPQNGKILQKVFFPRKREKRSKYSQKTALLSKNEYNKSDSDRLYVSMWKTFLFLHGYEVVFMDARV